MASLGQQLESLVMRQVAAGFNQFAIAYQRLLLRSALEGAPCVCLSMETAKPKLSAQLLYTWLLDNGVPEELIMRQGYGVDGLALTVLLHADRPVKISPTPAYVVRPGWLLEKIDVYP